MELIQAVLLDPYASDPDKIVTQVSDEVWANDTIYRTLSVPNKHEVTIITSPSLRPYEDGRIPGVFDNTVLFCDDEGLLKGEVSYINIPSYPQILAGRCLALEVDLRTGGLRSVHPTLYHWFCRTVTALSNPLMCK